MAMLVVWGMLLIVSDRTRLEQLAMTALGLFLSPHAFELISTDDRAGASDALAVGLPEFVFAGALFGTAAVFAHVMIPSLAAKWRGERIRFSHPAAHWVAKLLIVAGVWMFVSLSASLVFAFEALPAVTLGGLLVGIYVVADRKDLLMDALLTAVALAMLVFIVEQVFFARVFPEAAAGFWEPANLSGILLGGIPAEELLWAAIVGFTVGPLYEYVRHLRLT